MEYKSLLEFRKSKGLSQSEIAEKLGISLSFYSKIELGLRNPSGNFISKLKGIFPEFDTNIFFNNKSHVTCIREKVI